MKIIVNGKKSIALLMAIVIAIGCFFVGTGKLNVDAVSVSGDQIVSYAKQFIGYPYGSSYGPNSFDCCGLVKYVFGHFGISLPWNCYDYKDYGTVVSASNAKPGDLVVWHGKHVAIYIGDGNTINALNKSAGVCYTKVSNYGHYEGSTFVHDNPSYYIRVNGVGETVTVSFDANGGTASNSKVSFFADEKYGEAFPVAWRNGYTFDGWFTSASGGTQHTHTTKASKSVTKLYAHWVKNTTGVLEEGHIYKIYSKKSGLPLQAMGSSVRSEVHQMQESNSSTQLWRVISADDNGYYRLESLYGGLSLDMNADNKYEYLLPLKIYTQNTNSDAQFFSIISRGNGYYSIHSKNTCLALDIYDGSTEANAKVVQWDPHGLDNQLYKFEEIEDRTITFYNNYNNNYLPSLREVYEHEGSTVPKNNYNSRGDGVSVRIDPSNDSLIITQTVANKDNDMRWVAAMTDSNTFGPNALEDTTVELHFKAKASVSGANIQFRWGFDSVDNYYPAALTTAWKDYTVEIPRTRKSGNNLHPYIDKACTVEIKEIALYVKGSTGYIGDTDFYSPQTITENIYNSVVFGPSNPTREGYEFDGWYDKRVGGNLISSDGIVFIGDLPGNLAVYAHWIKSEVHVHSFTTTVTQATCETEGHTLKVCEVCGYAEDTVTPALGHDYIHMHRDATCTEGVYDDWTCSRCGSSYGGGGDPLGHDYYPAVTHEAGCTSDGYILYKCSRCEDEYTETLPAHGHDFGEWVNADQNRHKHVCSWDESHVEYALHEWDEGVITTQPTATSDGVMTYTCTVCGATKTDTIAVNYEKIAVKTLPTKTSYFVGDSLNQSGLTLTVTFNNGNTETISSGFTCTPTKLNAAGTQKITVSYGGKTTSFNVTVKNDTVSGIEIKAQPNMTTYYVGDSFDPTGMTLTATYASGKTKTIYEGFTCSPETLLNAGTQTITVTYGGKTATVTVRVNEDQISGITVATLPNNMNYYVGDSISTNGLTLNVSYASGKAETVDSGFTVTPGIFRREGTQTVTVQYRGMTTSFEVAVEELPVKSYRINYIVDGAPYYTGAYQEGFAITPPTVPTKAGYTFMEWSPALPAVMPGHDLTVNALFAPIKYNAEFIADGTTIAIVTYTVEDQSIREREPAVPQKTGYTAKWNDYELEIGGIKVYAVYTPIPIENANIKIRNFVPTRTEAYKTTITFTAIVTDAPAGATIQWFVNDKKAETGETCTVKQATTDFTVQCKLIGSDGSVLAESEIETVKVNTGFFAKLIAFFKGLFGSLPVIAQTIKETL